MLKTDQSPIYSTKLISLECYFKDLIKLYEAKLLPQVLMLNGKKGIGKFTLVFHFLNYIYSQKEKTFYNIKDNLIDTNSTFYNSLLNKLCLDVIFLQAEEGKNIKIEDVRNLKSVLSQSSISNNPRFIVIDDVEFLNSNSANALLKTLEEPSTNNYFILINNQQAKLVETISSRCLKYNIYLNSEKKKKIIKHLLKDRKINLVINNEINLTPGLFINYNTLLDKYDVDLNDNIYLIIKKLLHAYKKDKNENLISMAIFLIEQFFHNLVNKNDNDIDFLLNLKTTIIKKINDFIVYNLNINTVLNSIEFKLKHV